MISALPFGKFGDKESGQLPPSRLLRQLQFTLSFEEHSFRIVCCVKSAVLLQSPDGLSIVLAYCVSKIVHNIVQGRIPRISKDGKPVFCRYVLILRLGSEVSLGFSDVHVPPCSQLQCFPRLTQHECASMIPGKMSGLEGFQGVFRRSKYSLSMLELDSSLMVRSGDMSVLTTVMLVLA